MNFWHQAPFARLILPFMVGILCSVFTPIPVSWVLVLTCLLLFTYLILFLYLDKYHQRTLAFIAGVLIMLTFSGLGFLLHNRYHQLNDVTHFSYLHSEVKTLLITEAPVLKARSVKLAGEVQSCSTSNGWKHCNGKILLYIARDSMSENLHYGDVLLIKARDKEVPAPHNPGEFNYKRYLLFNNIFHQAYLKSGTYTLIKRKQGNPIFDLSYTIRDHLIALFKQHITGNKEAAVATALVFGYANELDPDLIQSYSNTGTLHVLAVSGMHVGIIYVILNWLLGFMNRSRRLAVFKVILIGLFLWAYSMIAGLSPSILRAATMFSFITVGQLLGRRSNIYNTLAASAFLLLLFKPTMMASVGFQLSYAAVIGIVFLQPKLYAIWVFRSYLADLIWKITAVSIAAQVTTFPLGLLYFHQFPNYFIFSNLIIIPLTTVVLYIGIVLIALSWQTTLATLIGKLMLYGIKATNALVEQIDKLPYATLNGISISIPETVLLYLWLFAFCGFFIYKRAVFLQVSLAGLLALVCLNIAEKTTQLQQKQISVYYIPGHYAIGAYHGSQGSLLADSELLQNQSALRFYIIHHWWQMGMSTIKSSSSALAPSPNLFTTGTKTLLHINGADARIPWRPMKVNYILISNNPYINIGQLKEQFNPEQLIFDGSNKARKLKFLKQDAAKHGLSVYDINEQGAWELTE